MDCSFSGTFLKGFSGRTYPVKISGVSASWLSVLLGHRRREPLEAALLLGRELVELRLAEVVALAVRVPEADDRSQRLVTEHARVEAGRL